MLLSLVSWNDLNLLSNTSKGELLNKV